MVLRLDRGELLDLVACELNVAAQRLSQWRETAHAAAAAALKECERDACDDEIDRLKAKMEDGNGSFGAFTYCKSLEKAWDSSAFQNRRGKPRWAWAMHWVLEDFRSHLWEGVRHPQPDRATEIGRWVNARKESLLSPYPARSCSAEARKS